MTAVLLAGAGPAAGQQAAAGQGGSPAAEERIAAVLGIPGDPAYGEYLGGECVTCHQQSGASSGIPPVVGHEEDYLVRALVEYQLGLRSNQVMNMITSRLGEEEIAALAAYFAGLDPN